MLYSPSHIMLWNKTIYCHHLLQLQYCTCMFMQSDIIVLENNSTVIDIKFLCSNFYFIIHASMILHTFSSQQNYVKWTSSCTVFCDFWTYMWKFSMIILHFWLRLTDSRRYMQAFLHTLRHLTKSWGSRAITVQSSYITPYRSVAACMYGWACLLVSNRCTFERFHECISLGTVLHPSLKWWKA